jgi:hypothetical protein
MENATYKKQLRARELGFEVEPSCKIAADSQCPFGDAEWRGPVILSTQPKEVTALKESPSLLNVCENLNSDRFIGSLVSGAYSLPPWV